MLKKIVVLAGLLTLAGCPYTEGCEALPAAADAGATGDGGIDAAPADAGDLDASDARTTFVPVGPSAPNCADLTVTCAGANCCTSTLVPGGTFSRSNDPAVPATVSDFKLDVYEVVLGRFRAFVNSGNGTQASPPAEGAGAHPRIAGSGWSSAWNSELAADSTDLVARLKCDPVYQVWTDAPGNDESRPMNCVTWYEASLFCAWDGGWLPTEAEWNYAAAGGNEQREFPWGAGLDATKANYGCTSTGRPNVRPCTFDDWLPVGSKSPAGDGRWGHADLAGNAWEWNLDWLAEPYYRLSTCNDCADLEQPAVETPRRVFRGGAFNWDEQYQRTSYRFGDPPTARYGSVGFRCARAQ